MGEVFTFACVGEWNIIQVTMLHRFCQINFFFLLKGVTGLVNLAKYVKCFLRLRNEPIANLLV